MFRCVSFAFRLVFRIALRVTFRFCARRPTQTPQPLVPPGFGRGCYHSAGSLICAILDRDLRNILDEFAQFEQLIELEFRGWLDGAVGKPIISSVRQVNHAWAIVALGSYLAGYRSVNHAWSASVVQGSYRTGYQIPHA